MLILVGCHGCLSFVLLACKGIAGTVEAALEVKDDIFKRLQFKTDEGLTRYPLVQIRRDVECEVINDVTDVGLSVVGQFFRNTFGKHLRVGIHDEQTQCCEE